MVTAMNHALYRIQGKRNINTEESDDMPLSARDHKNVTIDSLIGYCRSAYALVDSDKEGIKRWSDCLIGMADTLAEQRDLPSNNRKDGE